MWQEKLFNKRLILMCLYNISSPNSCDKGAISYFHMWETLSECAFLVR
jgi:hypothetical protein